MQKTEARREDFMPPKIFIPHAAVSKNRNTFPSFSTFCIRSSTHRLNAFRGTINRSPIDTLLSPFRHEWIRERLSAFLAESNRSFPFSGRHTKLEAHSSTGEGLDCAYPHVWHCPRGRRPDQDPQGPACWHSRLAQWDSPVAGTMRRYGNNRHCQLLSMDSGAGL